MTRERRVFVGIFGLAMAGLAVDRFILGPETASAAVPGVSAASVGGPLAGLADSVADGLRGSVQKALNDTLQNQLEAGMSGKAASLQFGPAEAWVRKPNAAPAKGDGIDISVTSSAGAAVDSREGQTPATATPGLTMVMPTSTGGIAMIDGVRLRVGQSHPNGYRLVSVDARTATIEVNGKRVVLSMPMPR